MCCSQLVLKCGIVIISSNNISSSSSSQTSCYWPYILFSAAVSLSEYDLQLTLPLTIAVTLTVDSILTILDLCCWMLCVYRASFIWVSTRWRTGYRWRESWHVREDCGARQLAQTLTSGCLTWQKVSVFHISSFFTIPRSLFSQRTMVMLTLFYRQYTKSVRNDKFGCYSSASCEPLVMKYGDATFSDKIRTNQPGGGFPICWNVHFLCFFTVLYTLFLACCPRQNHTTICRVKCLKGSSSMM